MDGQKDLDTTDKTAPVAAPSAEPAPPANATNAKPALSATSNKKPAQNMTQIISIALSALIVIVLIGGIYGVYGWQHGKVNSLNTQVTTLNSHIESLKNAPTPTPAPPKDQIQITPLGIGITVPPDLLDLTYSTDSSNNTVNLSTTSLTELSSSCGANSQLGSALGDLSKVTNTYGSSTSAILVKQFSDFYIAYTPAKTACSSDASVNVFVHDLVSDLENSFSTTELLSN